MFLRQKKCLVAYTTVPSQPVEAGVLWEVRQPVLEAEKAFFVQAKKTIVNKP